MASLPVVESDSKVQENAAEQTIKKEQRREKRADGVVPPGDNWREKKQDARENGAGIYVLR